MPLYNKCEETLLGSTHLRGQPQVAIGGSCLGNRFVPLRPCSGFGRSPSASCGNKAPVGAKALLKGVGKYILNII